MKFTQILTAASLAIFMPMVASASTMVTDSSYLDEVDSDVANSLTEDTLFMFEDVLDAGDSNGVIVLDFSNDLGSAVTLSAFATVNALGGDSSPDGLFGFNDLNLTPIGDSPGGIGSFFADVASGDDVSFFVRLGEIEGEYELDISFVYTVVPVPAAGFLLIGALGGLAALRRRKA